MEIETHKTKGENSISRRLNKELTRIVVILKVFGIVGNRWNRTDE